MNLFSKITTRNIDIPTSNGAIKGTLFIGNSEKLSPLIIFSHGLGDSAGSGVTYARSLVKHGFSTYIFDFNHGTIMDDMTKMSIFTEENDLNSIINYFEQDGYNNIFLLGASQGGVVSAMSAASHPEIQGLIMLYPAFVLRDQMLQMFSNQQFPKTFNLMGMTLGYQYLKDLPHYDLMQHVVDYQGPTLFIHGTSDNIAPISYSERLVNQYQDARLVKIPNAGHGFYGLSLSIVKDRITNFIQRVNKK